MSKGIKKVKTTLEELEVISEFKESTEWTIVKRWANRYINNLRRKAFKIPEQHPNFTLEHVDYTGQARGIKALIGAVDNAGKKLEKREKKKK
jgi:hypothetical protein